MRKEQYDFINKERSDDKEMSPFVFIPYFENDNGTRPLPSSIPSWQCSGIHIDGLPYNGIPLSAGVGVNLSVLVRNSGALSTAAVVRIYWADPRIGFTPQTVHLIGQTSFYIPAVTLLESPAIAWTPDVSVPAHSCLLAEVTSITDIASGTFDVINDRHYGQSNINILLAQPGQLLSFEFNAGNPSNKESEFTVRVRPLHEETIKILEKQYNAEAIPADLKRFYLRRVEPGIRQKRTQELSLVLSPKNQQLCQMMFDVPSNLEANQFIAIEIEQIVNEKDKNNVVGTIGLIAFADER